MENILNMLRRLLESFVKVPKKMREFTLKVYKAVKVAPYKSEKISTTLYNRLTTFKAILHLLRVDVMDDTKAVWCIVTMK
jgi:hypothetical protein